MDSNKYMKSLRLFFFVVIFIVCIVTGRYLFLMRSNANFQGIINLNYFPNAKNHSSSSFAKNRSKSKQNFLLLYWGFPWNLKSYVPPEGPNEKGCEVTHKRDQIAEADVVIFHYTIISSRNMPWTHYR